MAHIPVNHPLRPLYRLFAALIGLYVLIFGIFGVTKTWEHPLFARENTWVLGLRTNLAFALVSVVFGAIILFSALHRGNLGHFMNLIAGGVFIVTGLAMMAVLQTTVNILNFSMSTVIVSLIFGLLFLATGLYDKVGSPEDAHAENHYRHRPAPSHRR